MAAPLLALTLLSLVTAPAGAADSAAARAALDSLAVRAPDSLLSRPAADTLALRTRADSLAVRAPAVAPRPRPDSLAARPRIVRTFPPVEVWALVDDMASSQVVHPITSAALRSYPVGSLADLIALQPGVVAQAEELHVRGGRNGETAMTLEGVSLNEPFRGRALPVPLMALESARLVSGAPGAQYGGGIAGILDLRTVNPGAQPSAAWRWDTDGRRGTRYDRVAARAGAPLPLAGLGAVAAADVTLDDTSLPMLHTVGRRSILGLDFGWRAENQLLGFFKLAPVRDPERFSAQVIVGRGVHMPYDPDWSLDGWAFVPGNLKAAPTFSPVPLPGYQRWIAADHMAITQDEQLAALVKVARRSEHRYGSVTLGWQRVASTTSIGGRRDRDNAITRPRYGRATETDGYYALWGDWPLYQERDGSVLTLRGDGEITTPKGASVSAGAGLTYDDVRLFEDDRQPYPDHAFEPEGGFPVDSIRAWHAYAPGGFGYVQGRWLSGGMILNAGLRAEYFTAGPQAAHQTLPGSSAGVWSFGPRLGLAYPISVKDAFSFAYVRVQQAPGRDYLYDPRSVISIRQPMGNPAIGPATLISYEAAVKHLFDPQWALQTSVFYRDVYSQVGAVDLADPAGTVNVSYLDDDQSHAVGFELSLLHASARQRFEVHYTWMNAYGNESRPEGDPYGPVRGATEPATGTTPLSWDQRHTFQLAAALRGPHHTTLAWSSTLGSPLPWTPKPLRAPLTDLGLVDSRRLGWTERTDVDLAWSPPRARGLTFGIQVRNLFDNRAQTLVSIDGYPNPAVNTTYDDYAAWRTLTGNAGGAYWSTKDGVWVPVNDQRLFAPPRELRASVGASW